MKTFKRQLQKLVDLFPFNPENFFSYEDQIILRKRIYFNLSSVGTITVSVKTSIFSLK